VNNNWNLFSTEKSKNMYKHLRATAEKFPEGPIKKARPRNNINSKLQYSE